MIGVLLPSGDIDIPRTKILAEKAKSLGMSVTFHRAFDMTRDPTKSLQDLIDLKIGKSFFCLGEK